MNWYRFSQEELTPQYDDIQITEEDSGNSIILYAARKPIFVIDAYTRRIINRVGLAPDNNSYVAYQNLFMNNLPTDAGLFNEYHALLVCLGKDACRKSPRCYQCCLSRICCSYESAK